MPAPLQNFLSKKRLIIVCLVMAIVLLPGYGLAWHNPQRPQVSYECDRFALKFNHQTDRWECAKGTKKKETKETTQRIRQLKRDVDARIRELQVPGIKLQQEQEQRLRQLINQQQQLLRSLQQN